MSDENESLASVLGGSSAFHEAVKADTAQAVPEKVESEPAKPEPHRDETTGKFAKVEGATTEPAKAAAQPLTEERPKTPDSALAEMSRRLKVAEARVRELTPQEPAKPPPSIFEDEAGAFRGHIEAHTNPLRGVLLQQSVKIAQLVHKEGWAEAEAAFVEAAESDPSLVERFRAASDPGEFVYQQGTMARELGKHGGDVIAMRDAIRSESAAALAERDTRIKALEAEIAAMKQAGAELAEVPKSLNKRGSAHVNSETPTDEEDIGTIVRFGNKRG